MMEENILSEKDIVNKIRNEELSLYQVHILEENHAIEITDTIKWELVKKYPDICLSLDPTHEMIVYAICNRGYLSLLNDIANKTFFKNLSEEEIVNIISQPIEITDHFGFKGISTLLDNIK